MISEPDKATILWPFREVAHTGTQPLRIGVVVGSTRCSRWVESLVRFLRGLPGTNVCLIPLGESIGTQTNRAGWLWESLYAASRRAYDPFSETELAEADAVDRSDSIPAGRFDVLVWLASRPDPRVSFSSWATYGVFTVRLGMPQGFPFWDEVATEMPTSKAAIYWHDSSLLRGRLVREAETSTAQGLLFTNNAKEPLAGIVGMMASLCLEILRDGPAFVEKRRSLAEEPTEAAVEDARPSAFEVGRFIARKLRRSVAVRLRHRGRQPHWFVAARRNSGQSIADAMPADLSGFREIPLPPGSAGMADPFLVDFDGHTWLLFEDLPAGASRGRLACMKLSEQGSCSEMTVVMERDYHLSYPCPVSVNGELFLIPECRQARRIDLYRFAHFPSRIELVATLAEDVRAVDTTPLFLEGRWYFFTTTGQPYAETLLFWSNRLDGSWKLHPSSPISTSVGNSRSAGLPFYWKGRLYRPTQDCSIRYGYGIRVNEIKKLTPTEFEERLVRTIPPSWMPGLLGTHTWNEDARFQVIDGFRAMG